MPPSQLQIASILLALIPVLGCGRPAATNTGPAETDQTNRTTQLSGFADVAIEWGVDFINSPMNADEYQLPTIIGSGCAILDYDRNGHLDILFIAEESANKNVAFFSQRSPGKFTECSEVTGIADATGRGIAVGDCNNDGWPDLYFTSNGADQLWLNSGQGSFQNVTAECGIVNPRWGTSACWVDFDRDGWLDIFVTNYVQNTHLDCTRLGGGDADFCALHLFETTGDLLFRNTTGETEGQSLTFIDVSDTMGVSGTMSAGLGITAKDFNNDNWIDVYIASDQHPNILWINHQGSFTNESAVRGCDLDFLGRAQASMGIALGDVTGDGREDVTVSHLDGESHAVYRQATSGFYSDFARETGVATYTRPFTGFGICCTDVNLDGVAELITVNGRVKREGARSKIAKDFWAPYQQPMQMIESSQSQATTGAVQLLNGKRILGRGLAVGDLDRDGDPDIVCSTIGEPAVVLRNDYASLNDGFTLRIVDPLLAGRSCPGARATVRVGDRSTEHTFQPCQSYMSSHAEELYLSTPSGADSITVDIIWPHGSMEIERFEFSVSPHSQVTLERGAGTVQE